MKWSYRLLRVADIDIRVHATFALALLLGAFQFGMGYGARGALFGVLFVIALFICVTLHELGHSLVAQRFGSTVREIVLLPIGGVAKLLREPTRPLHELLVAVAGPLVNVVIALGLFIALGLDVERLAEPNYQAQIAPLFEPPEFSALFGWLLLGNVSLAVFNMIPAFPMDGGRVFRAILSFGLGRARATLIATVVGQLLAVLLIVVAIVSLESPILALIGLFVFFGASQEKQYGRAVQVLDDLSAGDVCDPHATHLSPIDDLGDVVDHALRTGQSLFPVVHGSELLGVVLREEALRAAARVGLRASVQVVLRRDFSMLDARVPISEVRVRIADTGFPVVVTDRQRFVGVLGIEDLSRIVALAARLASAGIRRPKPALAVAEVSVSGPPPRVDG